MTRGPSSPGARAWPSRSWLLSSHQSLEGLCCSSPSLGLPHSFPNAPSRTPSRGARTRPSPGVQGQLPGKLVPLVGKAAFSGCDASAATLWAQIPFTKRGGLGQVTWPEPVCSAGRAVLALRGSGREQCTQGHGPVCHSQLRWLQPRKPSGHGPAPRPQQEPQQVGPGHFEAGDRVAGGSVIGRQRGHGKLQAAVRALGPLPACPVSPSSAA